MARPDAGAVDDAFRQLSTARRTRKVLAGCLALSLLAGCNPAGAPKASAAKPPGTVSAAGRLPSRTPATGRAKPGAPATSASLGQSPHPQAAALLASMSEAQRVGQLLMVHCPSTYVAAETVAAITQHGVGSVILDGTSQLGLRGTAEVTRQLEQSNPSPARLFIATDQEGGLVQRLQGPGFTRIPKATQQGQQDPAELEAAVRGWASELRRAGVNVDLGPVLDTVPAGSQPNAAVGDLDREYGHTTAAVSSHGVAVVRGLGAAGVAATVKHFPGLGRVAGNTDTSSGVTDFVTTPHDRYLTPFAAAIKAGVPFVMMSTAIYSKIDPGRPAAFSPTIIGTVLRGDLGFTGVVISDDLGAAAQVSGYGVGQRAVEFIQAGGDIVLTVDVSQATEMAEALSAKARSDSSFKSKVDAAALLVLEAKQAHGLLGVDDQAG